MTESSRRSTLFCPHCGTETDCLVVRRPTTVTFRGHTYRTEEEFVRCSTCSQEFDMFGLMDPLKRVHEEYRREQGYPTAQEIKAVRQRMRLAEEEFARLIGTTKSTVRFYERGAIPKEEHAAVLKELVQRHLGASVCADSLDALFADGEQVQPWASILASKAYFSFAHGMPEVGHAMSKLAA